MTVSNHLCVFRALPIMFAVTLDLRIFANNVSVWLCDHSSLCVCITLSLCVCVCVCARTGGAAAAVERQGEGRRHAGESS